MDRRDGYDRQGGVLTDPDLGRRIAGNFFFWQGLRFVPFGVMILLGVALPLGVPALFPATDWFLFPYLAVLFAIAYRSMKRIGWWYHQTFGMVWERKGAHRRRTQIKWWVVYPLLGIAPLLDAVTNLPFLTSPLVLGAATVAYWNSTGRGRHHYLAISAVLASLSVLPLVGVVSLRAQGALVYSCIGLAFIVAGVLDHRELERVMGEPT